MPTLARVLTISVTDDTIIVDLDDGRTVAVPIGWYPRIASASAEERNHTLISGAGDGINWPDLDEDIGV